MNYDIEDMVRIISKNFAVHIAKQYSINKNDIDTHYTLGEIIDKERLYTPEKLIERSKELTNRLGVLITIDELKISLKFYNYIKNGMIKSYNIKWEDYLELIRLNDINEINSIISYNIYNVKQ